MRIAVAGATGAVGVPVVAALLARGHDVAPISRSAGVDLRTGGGVAQALDGADAVIDVANVVTARASVSLDYFQAATATLLAAGAAAGVRHHVCLSIVGCDRVALGYYRGKVAQERLVREGPLPWTILRSTQFFDFAAQLAARQRGPVVLVPRMLMQPVATADVAERLVDLALGPAAGTVPELAGPTELSLAALTRATTSRRVLAVRMPGRLGRQWAGGELLPQAAGPRGATSLEQWLGTR